MNKPTEREEFVVWFNKYLYDPNIGEVENRIKCNAAWAGWQARQTDLLCATELNKKYEQLCKDSSTLAERLQKENKKLRAKKSAEPKEILAAIDALSSRAVSYGGARNANNLASVRRAKKHLIEILGVKDE